MRKWFQSVGKTGAVMVSLLLLSSGVFALEYKPGDPLELKGMSSFPYMGGTFPAKEAIAHMVYLSFGEVVLKADQEAKNPINQSEQKIVGAITDFKWSGNKNDAIEFTVKLSRNNHSLAQAQLKNASKLLSAKVNFQIFSALPDANTVRILLKSFHSASPGAVSFISWQLEENRPKSTPLVGNAEIVVGSASLSVNLFKKELSFRLSPLPGNASQVLITELAPQTPTRVAWGPLNPK